MEMHDRAVPHLMIMIIRVVIIIIVLHILLLHLTVEIMMSNKHPVLINEHCLTSLHHLSRNLVLSRQVHHHRPHHPHLSRLLLRRVINRQFLSRLHHRLISWHLQSRHVVYLSMRLHHRLSKPRLVLVLMYHQIFDIYMQLNYSCIFLTLYFILCSC